MVDLLHTFGLVNYSILHQKKYPKLPRNEKNINCKQKPLLLFCPLDWGLGHVTRSIPLLQEFAKQGWSIVVACNSTQKKILEDEFSGLRYVEKQSESIQYGRNTLSTKTKIFYELIKILMQVKVEHRWMKAFLSENPVDLIISDNSYGAYSPSTPSIFITHQLRPCSGLGPTIDNLVQNFLKKYINRFSRCWVPDYSSGITLSGKLSHYGNLPSIPVSYIGPVSRLETQFNHRPTINLLVIISGPEPQRSIFENLVADQLRSLADQRKNFYVVIIRGLPGKNQLPLDCDAQQFNHVSAQHLSELASSSQFVISRSGYTTIMDMLKLKKKMIVVPTPGQTEQEYLATHLSKHNMAVAASQHNFSLEKTIRKAESFNYNFPDGDMKDYKKVISDLSRQLFPHYFG